MKSQELTDSRIRACLEHITEAGLQGSSAKLVPRGAVLMAMYGATVGKLGYLEIPAATNQAICALITDPDTTDSRFLYYAMMHSRGELVAHAQGAAQQNLSQATIRQFSLRVPGLSQQRQIGASLTAFDDLIENNRQRAEVLQEMARTIYREWFVHFRYPGHEGNIVVDSPLGVIPGGWEVRPFSETATFVNGFAFKPSHWSDAGRPIIKIKQLKQGIAADTPRCEEGEISKKFWVEQGDLLFSWSADLGVYRWSQEPGLLNQHLFTVRPSGRFSRAFLFFALGEAMPQFWARAQGTTMRHIKRSALSEVVTVVPGAELIDQFTDTVEPMAQAVITLTQSAARLAAIRDLLLPKLLTGEIDVSSLDLDALLAGGVM